MFYSISKSKLGSVAATAKRNHTISSVLVPVVRFSPIYRLGHLEKYLFSLCIKILSGSKYPKHIFVVTFANKSTVWLVSSVRESCLFRASTSNSGNDSNATFGFRHSALAITHV